jgi:hypothetical protein
MDPECAQIFIENGGGFLTRQLRQRGQFEIAFAFARAGLNHQAINNISFKRLCARAFHGGMHPANSLAINDGLDRRGIGFGNQMPERNGLFVRRPFVQRDDLEAGQFVFSVQAEGDIRSRRIIRRTLIIIPTVNPRRMDFTKNLDFIRLEKLRPKPDRTAEKSDEQCDLKNCFFVHGQVLDGARPGRVSEMKQPARGVRNFLFFASAIFDCCL